jgi:hypothetical protein
MPMLQGKATSAIDVLKITYHANADTGTRYSLQEGILASGLFIRLFTAHRGPTETD